MISSDYRQALTRYANKDVDVVSRKGGGFTVTVPCTACGSTLDAMSMGALMAPHTITAKLRSRGWQIGRHSLCPDHKNQKRNERVSPQVTIVCSENAREAKRLAMMALDDYFDASKGQYRDGKSDAVIAKDCGLAVAIVVKLREEFYGVLRAPSEFERLLAEARAKVGALDALRIDAQATIARLDSYAKAQGWA